MIEFKNPPKTARRERAAGKKNIKLTNRYFVYIFHFYFKVYFLKTVYFTACLIVRTLETVYGNVNFLAAI